ncbi:MAG TPA: LysE family transporter [Alphaproteobacteria bacterium]|nr:LysE family transporter [Alphaproteobacteria bacterium]
MDTIGAILRGIAIGLAVAIPVGPMALLCMRRTLVRGFAFGFATGFGAALADLFYSAIAVFGIAAIESILLDYRLGLSLIGGIFLLALAARTALSHPANEPQVSASTGGILRTLASSVVLTATNPLTVLGFIAIFAGLGVGNGLTNTDLALDLVLGVFAGSAAWWLLLSTIIASIRHLFAPRTLHRLNLGAAALLAAFGVYELISALKMAAPWLF